MKLLWSLFGALSDGLKDNAALQMHIAADGKMDLMADKQLVFDDESSQDAYLMGQGSESSDTPCRTVASDCSIKSSPRGGNRNSTLLHYKFDTVAVQDYNTPVLNQAAANALATALDFCEAKCTNHGTCQNFYFLKNKETGEEECWFYEPEGDSRVYIEEKQYYALSSEESKWDLCIWQPGSEVFVEGLNLCNNKLGKTPAELAEEAAAKAERVRVYYAAKAERERIFQEGLAKKRQDRKDKAQLERTQFSGVVGESIQFKNDLQGRCLTAADGPNGNLTFSNCNDTSVKTLWTKGLNGSYESAAYPGRCPREGDGVRCRREYVVLGECPGFITWSDGYGKVLKLEQDGKACLGTWAESSYINYTRSDGSIRKKYDGMVVSPHYQNNVISTASANKCGNPGSEWERVVTTPYP